MKKYAIIVAGGSGLRMGSAIPKQFLLLKGKPILYYTIKAFLDAYQDLELILVLPMDFTDMGQEIIDAFFDKSRIRITGGGDTRFQSVKNGLSLVEGESIVFVHDGVRCLITKALIERCYAEAVTSGSAIPTIVPKDSIRIIRNEQNEAFDRNKVRIIQTPQTFHSRILIPAFQIDYKDRFTDEATVVEAFGMKLSLVEGEETNIKITQSFDMVLAEKILESRLN
jgi:2-C-methyl-D-erythritol 4-phosphate cytidylyltransferase